MYFVPSLFPSELNSMIVSSSSRRRNKDDASVSRIRKKRRRGYSVCPNHLTATSEAVDMATTKTTCTILLVEDS